MARSCDRCGKPVSGDPFHFERAVGFSNSRFIVTSRRYELCHDCCYEVSMWLNNDADFVEKQQGGKHD